MNTSIKQVLPLEDSKRVPRRVKRWQELFESISNNMIKNYHITVI